MRTICHQNVDKITTDIKLNLEEINILSNWLISRSDGISCKVCSQKARLSPTTFAIDWQCDKSCIAYKIRDAGKSLAKAIAP